MSTTSTCSEPPVAGPAIEKGKAWTPYQMGMVAMFFLSMVIAYMDRVNFSVVIPTLMKEYHLAPEVAGVLLSIFSWALAAAYLFSGPLVDRFHSRRMLPGGVGVWSLATFIAGLSATVPVLGAARVLLGLGESTQIPSVSKLISELFPKSQRGKAVGIYFSGSKIGLVIGAPLAAAILAEYGWHMVFFATGIISAMWLVPWFLIYRPGKEVIQEELPAKDAEAPQLPAGKRNWTQLFSYKETWVLMLGQAGYLYVYFVFLSWLPSYLILERGMSVLKTGIFSTFPFIIAVFVGIFSGWLSDRWIQHGGTMTLVRKTFIGGGFALSTIFIVIATNITSEGLSLLFLFMSMGILGMTSPNINALPIDLSSGEVVSSVAALQNLGGSIGSALSPIVTGILYASTGSFQVALLVTGGVALVFGTCVHVFLLDKIEPRIGIKSNVSN